MRLRGAILARLMWKLPCWCHNLVFGAIGWRVMTTLEAISPSNQVLCEYALAVKDGEGARLRQRYTWIRKWPPAGCKLVEEEPCSQS